MEVVLIDHYDSFTHNILDWLAVAGGFSVRYVAYDDQNEMSAIEATNLPLVVSPGPKSPIDAEPTRALLRAKLGQVPLLGICLGHQILGTLAGARVVRVREPWHGASRQISVLRPEGLFENFPSAFKAASYNSLTLDPSGWSAGWEVVAVCDAGEVQAIRFGGEADGVVAAYGVQFHPESFLSDEAARLGANWARLVARWKACHETL